MSGLLAHMRHQALRRIASVMCLTLTSCSPPSQRADVAPQGEGDQALERPSVSTLAGAFELGAWRPSPRLDPTREPLDEPLKALALLAPPTTSLPALPELPKRQHLCVGFAEGGPPTIAWGAHESPALRWPPPPSEARDLLLLMIDWDTPLHRHWERLNSAHLSPLSEAEREGISRAPFVLWATVGLKPRAPALGPQGLHGLPQGFGGRGWRLKGRAGGYFAQGEGKESETLSPGYSALNDYSWWFKASELTGAYGGYGGPCVPLGDPQPHRVSVLLFTLDAHLALPSVDAPPLKADELLKIALKHTRHVSQLDWRASLPHDTSELSAPRP